MKVNFLSIQPYIPNKIFSIYVTNFKNIVETNVRKEQNHKSMAYTEVLQNFRRRSLMKHDAF